MENSRKIGINSERYPQKVSNSHIRQSPNRSNVNNKIKTEQLKSKIKQPHNTPNLYSRSGTYQNRYSKKLPISFIAAKDWRLYIQFTNKIIISGLKKPRTRVNRLFYSFLKLYHEYSYVCDNFLHCQNGVNNISHRNGDDRTNNNQTFDESGRESKLSRSRCQNNSVTFNDRVTWSNYNRYNDGLSIHKDLKEHGAFKTWFYNKFRRLKHRQSSTTKPYDKIRRYQQESIEIYSTEKTQKVVSHRISFTGFDSVGRPKIKWIQVPIALELLIPKIQAKIQRIMMTCTFLYDPLEVAAELRYFNYNVDNCILHFEKTKKFRDILEEFLPKRSQIKELENNSQLLNKFQNFFEKISNDRLTTNDLDTIQSLNNPNKKTLHTSNLTTTSISEIDIKSRSSLNQIAEKSQTSYVQARLVKIVCNIEKLKLTKVEIRQLVIKTQIKYKKQIHDFIEKILRTVDSFKDFLMTEEQRNRVMHLLKQNDELKIKLKDEEKKRKTIYNMMQDQMGNVRVYCRCRAMDKHQSVLDIKTNDTIAMQIGFCEEYKFDKVFEPFRAQAAIYEEFQPLILSFIDGFNVCFITYGGEASGKTYTLLGATLATQNINNKEPDKHDGIMKRALKEVITEQSSRRRDWDYNLAASVVEIYNDTFVDLLTGESGIHLPIDRGLEKVQESLKSVPVTCDADIEALIKVCKLKRKVGRTALNPQSSRSHLIAMIHLTGRSKIHGETISSFLAMCDLAGFEDILKAETHNNQTLSKEAGYINKSLTAFNRVFTSLRRQDPNTVSYRDTKLTYLLKPFLTNQGKCVLIVTVRTDKSSLSSTQSTLRFGRESRAVTLGKAKRQANLDKIIY